MSWPRGVRIPLLAGVLGLAIHACAQDAPLSEAKQQLKELRQDATARRTGAAGEEGLSGAGNLTVPQITPAAPIAQPEQRPAERENTGAARKNWLLDGVTALERKRPSARVGNSYNAGDRDAEQPPLDPADPDYFLRLYERERTELLAQRERTARNASDRSVEGDVKVGATPDAFAPLLERWLADSPVRDAIREARGEPRGGREAFASDGRSAEVHVDSLGAISSRVATSRQSEPFAETAAARTAENPYLASLGLSASPPSSTAPAMPPPVAVPRSAPSAREQEITPLAPRAPEPVRRPLGPQDDSRKYFPQLKKF